MQTPFVFLTLAIVFLWQSERKSAGVIKYAWAVAFVAAVALALYGGQLDVVALIPILLFAVVCYYFNKLTGTLKWMSGVAIVLFCLAFGMHVFPGFHNPIIVEHVLLSQDSIPYTLRFNFDKALVGLFIIFWLHPLVPDVREFFVMLKKMLPVALISLFVVMMFSFLLGYVRFDTKLPDFLGYWLWANLFFTCVAEEALFRGFLQKQLSLLLNKLKYGAMIALFVCAILFGLAHAGGGAKYVLLATVAGLGYGMVYYRTQRIESSILLHFVLNSIHILFFSYPALMP